MMAYVTDVGPASVTEAFYGLNYAVQVVKDGPIKIGFTKTAASSRLSALQQACPYELELIAQWPATEGHEKRLHSDLAAFRIRREWYHPVTPVKERLIDEVKASRLRDHERIDFIARYMGGDRQIAQQYGFDARFKHCSTTGYGAGT